MLNENEVSEKMRRCLYASPIVEHDLGLYGKVVMLSGSSHG